MTLRSHLCTVLGVGIVSVILLITDLAYYGVELPARRTLEMLAVFAFPGSLCASLMSLSVPPDWPIIVTNIAGVAAILVILAVGRRLRPPSCFTLAASYLAISVMSGLPILHFLFW